MEEFQMEESTFNNFKLEIGKEGKISQLNSIPGKI